jgi:hypothetical protein
VICFPAVATWSCSRAPEEAVWCWAVWHCVAPRQRPYSYAEFHSVGNWCFGVPPYSRDLAPMIFWFSVCSRSEVPFDGHLFLQRGWVDGGNKNIVSIFGNFILTHLTKPSHCRWRHKKLWGKITIFVCGYQTVMCVLCMYYFILYYIFYFFSDRCPCNFR